MIVYFISVCYTLPMITKYQTKAARALLDLKQAEAAELAGVSISTMRDFETGKRTPHPSNLIAIQQALEAAGIEFIAENGGGAGVRLRK